MSYYVPFNGGKRKIRYSDTIARNISLLFSFFKLPQNQKKFVSNKKIREYVKISSTIMWQLAYQGYFSVSIRRFRLPEGICVQSFRWKANMKRFEEFINATKLQDATIKIKIEEKKKFNSTNMVEQLQNPEEELEEDEDS